MDMVAITRSAAFGRRQLRSEQVRCALLGSAWAIILCLVALRRVLGDDPLGPGLFRFTTALMGGAMLFQVVGYALATMDLRAGRSPPVWRGVVSSAVDLAFPLVSLASLELGAGGRRAGGMTAPAVVIVSLVIALTILKLRPAATLASGIVAGLGHWLIVVLAINAGTILPAQAPVFISYGLAFVLVGIACSFAAREVRGYVADAVAEALIAEQKERELAQVSRGLAVARGIQMGLMPSAPPSLAGFDIAGMTRPAEATGGDYYDWDELPSGRLLASIADVTGHGIGPALAMAACRAYARSAAPTISDLPQLLGHLNQLICSDLGTTGRFITMATVVLSSTGQMQLISAGHGPSVLYRAATGRVEIFAGNGIPLGIDRDETYGPVADLQLAAGDVLVLLTDGFVEWKRKDDREQWGVQRLSSAVREAAGGTAAQILAHIDARVQEFSLGAPQLDDTAAVVIKRTGR
ncbi:MAG: hypothetical protein GIKADHBN_01349 [Phycisphaerales bacterium]|nr:hypothetical protein [Phycisphaerales bacterium]